jgi:hypothetical protein
MHTRRIHTPHSHSMHAHASHFHIQIPYTRELYGCSQTSAFARHHIFGLAIEAPAGSLPAQPVTVRCSLAHSYQQPLTFCCSLAHSYQSAQPVTVCFSLAHDIWCNINSHSPLLSVAAPPLKVCVNKMCRLDPKQSILKLSKMPELPKRATYPHSPFSCSLDPKCIWLIGIRTLLLE